MRSKAKNVIINGLTECNFMEPDAVMDLLKAASKADQLTAVLMRGVGQATGV